MGFFKKLWKKTVGKVWKRIGKTVKSVFKKVGKFMNKIGIVGQIAMSFLLPGIGNALMAGFGNVVSSLAGGALGSIGKAAGWVLGKAGTFAKTIGQGFKTVSGAVTDFIGTAGKYVGNKLNITNFQGVDTLSQAFGKEGWGGRLTDSFAKLGDQASNFWNSTTADFADRGIMTAGEKAIADLGTFNTPEINLEKVKQISPEITQSGTGALDQRFNIEVDLDKIGNVSNVTGPKSMGINLDNVAELGKAESKNWFSKGLEKMTGEATVGAALKAAPGKAGEYAYKSLLEAPGKAVSSVAQTGLAKAVGLGPEEYKQGRSWAINNPHAYQSGNYAQSQQEAFNIPFEAFAQQNMAVFNTDPQGYYGGVDFYNRYMQRYAGQGG